MQDNVKSLENRELFQTIVINIECKDLNNCMIIQNVVLRLNFNIKKNSCDFKNSHFFDFS